MSKHWVGEGWRLALVLLVAVIGGVITGAGLWLPTCFLLGYSAWMIYRLHELEHWLQSGGKKKQAPDTIGIASEIVQLIYREKKLNTRQKNRLRASLTQFNDMAAELPDATVVLDNHLQIRWSNTAAAELLGINRSRDSGQRIDNLIRNPAFNQFLQSLDSKAEIEIQSPLNAQITIALRRVPSGEKTSIVSGRDVTQRVVVREMRKTFVANVSHELRTPLTVIKGYLEMLAEDDKIPPHALNALKKVTVQSDRMGNIVSDLLTLSRLESNVLASTEGEPVDIDSIISNTIKEANDISDTQHVFILNTDARLRVRGVATELYSACQNLLQNAIRYTEAGTEITVGWKQHGEGSLFYVSDKGPGIEPHHIPRLSERFYRVDQGRSRENGGTGLGLAIVKYIAQRHGGSLNIRSRVGAGSTFEILFPAERTLRVN